MRSPKLNLNPKMYKDLSLILFCSSTTVLFIYLNRVQPHYFIDEVFHIPQAMRYCAGNFTQWDPKITTLPGLYLLTAAILSPLNLCNVICIRSINLVATFLNLYFIHAIIKERAKPMQKEKDWTILATAYNITLLPTLFFWHFLYYTDVISVSTILLMLLLHLRKRFNMAAFTGLIAIIIRQTNIIWLAFVTLERGFDLLDNARRKPIAYKHRSSPAYIKVIWKQVMSEVYQGPVSFFKFVICTLFDLLPYLVVCILFLIFVIWNKGIVVGDHTAHVPTIHVPQLFYFSIFTFGFSWPYMITYWKKYFNFIHHHWILGSCLFAFLSIVVHSNTMVHPYVLADNRHYVFYIWNKFMGRFSTQINYFLMTSAVLIPQLLLEPRYFIIPYIIYRLNIQKPTKWQIVMESLTTLIVNFLQFFIFVNKVFYWDDLSDPQRISW